MLQYFFTWYWYCCWYISTCNPGNFTWTYSQCLYRKVIAQLNCISNNLSVSLANVFVCRIAIAYSMGQIINSVCLCHSVCPSFCLCSLSQLHSGNKPQKQGVCWGVNIAPLLLPFFCPQTAILCQKVLKIHANIIMPISALNVWESPEFPRHIGNTPRNTIVTSDFRPEVEMRQFRACTLKKYVSLIYGRIA